MFLSESPRNYEADPANLGQSDNRKIHLINKQNTDLDVFTECKNN